MDFLRTLKKRRTKKHVVPARVNESDPGVPGGFLCRGFLCQTCLTLLTLLVLSQELGVQNPDRTSV